MRKIHTYIKKSMVALAISAAVLVSSCKKFVEVDIAPNLISTEAAYTTDLSATSAVLSMYSYYPTVNAIQYFSVIGGLASDELQFTSSNAELDQFAQNSVINSNSYVSNYLWIYPYMVIRNANLAIKGITESAGMTAPVKSQLLGEAKFMRAFMYFNMVNYMGGVPLSLDPVELNNALLPRATPAAVYAQIITDLKDAQVSLPATYVGTGNFKIRANKWAATALLARAYLYQKDYVNAELEATKVIASGVYTLPALNAAFINTSTETILQFATLYGSSSFGSFYRTTSSAANVAPPSYVLYPRFTAGFETGDNRKTAWVDSTTTNAVKYYRINKYKLSAATATATGNEYSVVLRLAEQYLIRAEARALQNNVAGAQSDLNLVRSRAGLGITAAASTAALVTAIAKERKMELFGEFSHRWFDLKRTSQADAVIGALKTTYTPDDKLMPVPVGQILVNANLSQNPGY